MSEEQSAATETIQRASPSSAQKKLGQGGHPPVRHETLPVTVPQSMSSISTSASEPVVTEGSPISITKKGIKRTRLDTPDLRLPCPPPPLLLRKGSHDLMPRV